MSVTVQFIAGVVRAGDEHHRHGDPYTFAATVARVDDETCEVLGATSAPTKAQTDEMRALAATMGFRWCIITRIRRDGSAVRARVDCPNPGEYSS